MKKVLITSLLILALAVNIFGQQFYISPTGNDATGSGTITAPWKTLAKATATVTVVGSTINVLAGSYTETQQSYLKVGVSIKGAGASSTIIKSTLTGDYKELINLQSSDKTIGNQEISGITLDGSYVSTTNYKTWLAIWITGLSNVAIHDCVIKNFLWRGVIFNGINADNPGTDVGFTKATGNKFYNNVMTNCADYGISGGGSGALNLGFQNGMLIYNNTIQQNERPEGKNGWPIKYWNQGWLDNVKIYNNTIIKKPYGGTYPGESGWDFAIEFFSISGLEIYGNDIQNGAIDLNYNYKKNNAYSTWIHDNKITNVAPSNKVEGGIILEFRTESAIIENNTFSNKSYGVSFNTRTLNSRGDDRNNFVGGNVPGGYSYLVDNIIRNNLFINMHEGTGMGNRFCVGVISESGNDPQISNMQIYSNTMVAKISDPCYLALDFSSQENGKITGLTVKDNIMQGFADGSIFAKKAATQTGVSITNNDYYNCAAPVWPSATITGNLNLNPQFSSSYASPLLASNNMGWNGGGAVSPPCTSWIFGAWSPCNNGLQTRVLLSSLPSGCVGTVPPDSLVRTCTVTPPTCIFTYTDYGACDPTTGRRYRTVLSVSPAGCTGTPILSEPCTIIPPPPVYDTTYCTVIQHGINLTRRTASYFVKRPDGFTYDNNGVKRDIYLFKSLAAKWYYLGADKRWYLLF